MDVWERKEGKRREEKGARERRERGKGKEESGRYGRWEGNKEKRRKVERYREWVVKEGRKRKIIGIGKERKC